MKTREHENIKTREHESMKTEGYGCFYVFMFLCFHASRRGATALVVVLIIGAASLIMAYGATLLGLGELNMSYTARQGGGAMAGAESCLEEALIRLKHSPTYSGGNLEIGEYSCIINISGSGDPYMVSVESSYGDYTKKIEAEAVFDNGIPYLDSWREVSP